MRVLQEIYDDAVSDVKAAPPDSPTPLNPTTGLRGSLPLSSPFLDITQSGQRILDSHLSDVLAVVARVHYTMMSFGVARSLFRPQIGQ